MRSVDLLSPSPSMFTAHKLHPVRARVINDVTGEAVWLTLAYIPAISKLKEPSAAERARQRRSDLLQRLLYLVFRSTIAASHEGVDITVEDRTLRVFRRTLLDLADLPEERSVLCLKSGSCTRPCSKCDVFFEDAGSVRALNAKDRDVLRQVPQQIECSQLRLSQTQRQRRAYLEASSSVNSTVPALAGMAGLGTHPFLLYNMIGFETLHVRFYGASRPPDMAATSGARTVRADRGTDSDSERCVSFFSPLCACTLSPCRC